MPAVKPESIITPPNRKVLYCLEDTDADFAHFEWALMHFFKDDDHITVADVKHKPKPQAHTPEAQTQQMLDEACNTDARISQRIKSLVTKSNKSNLDVTVIVECEEKAGHYLVHLAEEIKPDVILVGSIDRKGLIKDLFKRNVGRYVAKHADAAVVAVKDLEHAAMHPNKEQGVPVDGLGAWAATGLPAPVGRNVDEAAKLGETHPSAHQHHHTHQMADPESAVPGVSAWVAPGHITPEAPTNAGINAKVVI